MLTSHTINEILIKVDNEALLINDNPIVYLTIKMEKDENVNEGILLHILWKGRGKEKYEWKGKGTNEVNRFNG